MTFDLDPDRVHLNHGAFGALPREVVEEQARWRTAAERNPHGFHRVVAAGAVEDARAAAAAFLHLGADDVALVRNVSEGVATVLAGVGLRAGDEVVVGDHAHGGVRLAVDAACRRTGARAVEVGLPLDATDEEVVAAFAGALTDRTRLVLVDQVTSLSATVHPVAAVARAVRRTAPGARVLVDAAHVPGQVDVDPLGARRRLLDRQPLQVGVHPARDRGAVGGPRAPRRAAAAGAVLGRRRAVPEALGPPGQPGLVRVAGDPRRR